MKAITILQPYAHMIAVSLEKRVENRTWPTNYRGPLLVHAGLGRQLWDPAEDRKRFPGVSWGAVVGVARLVACVRINDIKAGRCDETYPWLRSHVHTIGPWCWVLEAVRPLEPWPYRGRQGLFDIDEPELERLANAALNAPATT